MFLSESELRLPPQKILERDIGSAELFTELFNFSALSGCRTAFLGSPPCSWIFEMASTQSAFSKIFEIVSSALTTFFSQIKFDLTVLSSLSRSRAKLHDADPHWKPPSKPSQPSTAYLPKFFLAFHTEDSFCQFLSILRSDSSKKFITSSFCLRSHDLKLICSIL